MPEITAALVKAFREKTGLSLGECRKALDRAQGDEEKAIQILREESKQKFEVRATRETAFGRFGIFGGVDQPRGAIVELKCESAPVASTEEFIQLANDLAKQLAVGPGAATGDELLSQPSPSKPGQALRQQVDDLFNRMREVLKIGRMARFEGPCGCYSHNSGTVSGVLVQVKGGNDTAARDVCMHVAAMRPQALIVSDLDPVVVQKEREVLRAAALNEGKPANIVDKMVEGRLRNFYGETVLTEQPFVKDDKQTVGKYAQANGMELVRFVHWELGKE